MLYALLILLIAVVVVMVAAGIATVAVIAAVLALALGVYIMVGRRDTGEVAASGRADEDEGRSWGTGLLPNKNTMSPGDLGLDEDEKQEGPTRDAVHLEHAGSEGTGAHGASRPDDRAAEAGRSHAGAAGGDGGELRASGVTVGGTPDPDDPAAVAPWPPAGEEHLAEKETKSRDEHDLPSPGVTVGGTPDPNDPAAVAPWHPDDDQPRTNR